jgi:beta-lactam-binding protein with PASTA domain/predicted Ser/Thr protein kinase
MPEIAPDTLVDGRYKVLTRIGSGGMADVFCAEDQQLGRKVALKLLHHRYAADAEFVERFRREASSAASLQHPNVVGVYDRGAWDSTYYIAMEYLPGRSLKEVVQQEAPLDPVRAIDLTVQILKAARFAHRRGIVHRDLKPHNVLVDDEDRVKVTDFGIARAGASDMTETGSIMGTAQYLSPEQAQGHEVSPSSDLYAIGVILFELLTGHVPFDADSAVTIALKHVSEPPPPPSAFDPAVPPELETITLWALSKDPAQRPPDADAFIAALEEAREHVLAREAPGSRTAMFAPVVPVPLPATAIPSAAAAAYETAPVYDAPPPYLPDDHAPRPRRRMRWWGWALVLLALAGIGVGTYLLLRPHEATVPAVVGRNLQAATSALRGRGLGVRVVRVVNAAPVDRVLAQDPSGGTQARKGSAVTLTVSGGPGEVPIPSLDGLDEQQATATLTDAGLVVARVAKQPDETVPAGEALRTSPAEGVSVAKGSDVTLVVSTGPRQVSVPDVRGLARADAKAALKKAGFKVGVTEQPSRTAVPDTVLSQSPVGSATPGSEIALVVATAPQVRVPALTGQTEAAAINALSAAGLTPRESTRAVSDPTQDGIVLDQRPAEGTKVAKGAPVRIVVGRYQAPSTTPSAGAPGAPAGGGAP